MYFSRHILLKKITAVLLIALFVFIYAEKVFHTHDKTVPFVAKGAATFSLNNNACPICDFQLAANTDLPLLQGIEAPFFFFNTAHCIIVISLHSSLVKSFSGRGPPFSI